MNPLEMFFWLMVGHAVCDFPLQGDFLANFKSHRRQHPYCNVRGIPWQWCMLWHSMIHAGAVALITGYWVFAIAEFVLHFWIDYAKCNGETNFTQDQILHVFCKTVLAIASVAVVT